MKLQWSCNISQTEVSCGRSMACAQWIWNTQGLTVCPIEDLLDVNHLTWEGTESPVCPESVVGLCLYIDGLCCGLCETPWYVSNPWMALCRLWQWFLEISHRHLKLTSSSYLDFLLPPLCLEKSACMVTVYLYCSYLQGNKHTEWSLHSVTFGFLFLLYFVYKTISVKNFCQMCVCFFLVTMLAIILRTSVELLGYSYVELKITVDTTLGLNVLSVYLKQPVITSCIVCRFF